jgi:hypothetical protein
MEGLHFLIQECEPALQPLPSDRRRPRRELRRTKLAVPINFQTDDRLVTRVQVLDTRGVQIDQHVEVSLPRLAIPALLAWRAWIFDHVFERPLADT